MQKVTLSELARLTGIARVSLSRYGNGRQDLTLGQLAKIASCLECRLTDLVDDREDLASPSWRRVIRRQGSRLARHRDVSWVPRALLAARAGPAASLHEKI